MKDDSPIPVQRKILLGGDALPEELRPVAPALIAGAARGAPAGAVGAWAATFVLWLFAGGHPAAGDYLLAIAVLGVIGAALGATLSAGDAASRRARWPIEVYLGAAALAPIAAFAAGVSAVTAASGRFGWQTALSPSDLRALIPLAPVVIGFMAGAAVAGPARPGGGWEHAFYRGACIAGGPTVVLLVTLIFLVGDAEGSQFVKVVVLGTTAIAAGTIAHVGVHGVSRPIYRRVRAWLEPES